MRSASPLAKLETKVYAGHSMLEPERTPPRQILETLPIFPLPNVVFLPGMVLPLNVFEPRYLDLVDHVLDAGKHVGVPLLRPHASLLEPEDLELPVHACGDERPPIEAVFGVGRLLAHQRLPDGRRFIRLEGLGRVHVLGEAVQEHSFRCVRVRALPEDLPRDLHAFEVLKAQIERMAETFDEDDREMIHAVLELDDVRVIIYAIASLVPNIELMRAVKRGLAPGEHLPHLRLQQRCLSALDADQRVALLSDRAQLLIEMLGESGSFPVSVLNPRERRQRPGCSARSRARRFGRAPRRTRTAHRPSAPPSPVRCWYTRPTYVGSRAGPRHSPRPARTPPCAGSEPRTSPSRLRRLPSRSDHTNVG
jgi:Lon protease-like protein